MPFKSQAQRRLFHATMPKLAKEWEKETPKGKLPEKVKDKKDPPKEKGLSKEMKKHEAKETKKHEARETKAQEKAEHKRYAKRK